MAIVKAFWEPITFDKLHPKALQSIEVAIDPKHPVSAALLDSVARMSDADIKAGIKLIDGAKRDDADTRSWRALLVGELEYRAQLKTNPLAALVAATKEH